MITYVCSEQGMDHKDIEFLIDANLDDPTKRLAALAEHDRLIAEKAWARGHHNGVMDAMYAAENDWVPNPYRKEEA